MSLNMRKKTIVVIALALLVPLMLSAQAPLSSTIWLRITDDAGGRDSLIFGNHMNATFCTDTALGENQGPPSPPGFSAVFLNIPGRVDCFTTNGQLKKDLRDYSNATRKDTFFINFRNADSTAAFPNVSATLHWPIRDSLLLRCDSLFLYDRSAGAVIPGRINMFNQDSVVLTGVYDPFGGNPSAPDVKIRIYKFGSRLVDGVEPDKQGTVPKSFALHQNYPNPFNPTTSMRFEVLNQALTDISVYNILGQKVTTLVSREMSRGSYTATWNGLSDQGLAAPSGVYFVRMSARSTGSGGKEEFFSAVRKLVLMK